MFTLLHVWVKRELEGRNNDWNDGGRGRVTCGWTEEKRGRKLNRKKRKKTSKRGEKLKPFKIKRYELEPFFSCCYDFETKRKKETLSKWPRIFALAVKGKKIGLGRETKMRLNMRPNSRTYNKRNEQFLLNKFGRGSTIVERLDKMCMCGEMQDNSFVKLLRSYPN
jgi:hypothetical protein